MKEEDKFMKVEFFHDVLCAYCYSLSPKVRELQAEFPDLEIVHRSYALISNEKEMIEEYGSGFKAKELIVDHWDGANKVDADHRLNIVAMKKTNFPFPISTPCLLACEAARMIGGEGAYWDMFDGLQKAFYTDSLNIGDEEVISKIAAEQSFDYSQWNRNFHSDETMDLLKEDYNRVEKYGVDIVPYLVFDEKNDDKHKMAAPASLKKMISFVESLNAEER